MAFSRTTPFGSDVRWFQGPFEVHPNKFLVWIVRNGSGKTSSPYASEVWGSEDGGVTWSKQWDFDRTFSTTDWHSSAPGVRFGMCGDAFYLPVNDGADTSDAEDKQFTRFWWDGGFTHSTLTRNAAEVNNRVDDIDGVPVWSIPDGSGRTITAFAAGRTSSSIASQNLYRFSPDEYNSATATALVNDAVPNYIDDWQHSGDGRTPASATAADSGVFVEGNNSIRRGRTSAGANAAREFVPSGSRISGYVHPDGQTLIWQKFGFSTNNTNMLFCDGSHIWVPYSHGSGYNSRLALVKWPYSTGDPTVVLLPNTISGQWRQVALWGRKLFGIVQTSTSSGRWIYYDLDTGALDLMDTHSDFRVSSAALYRQISTYPPIGVMYPSCPNWLVLGWKASPTSGATLYLYRMSVNQAPDTPRITSPSTGSSISHSQSLTLTHTFNDADMDSQSRKEIQRRVSGVSDYWNGSSWSSSQSSSTQRPNSSTNTNFTAAQWLKQSTINNGAYPNHEFRIRVRDDNTDPEWSDWSDWISLTIIAAPTIGGVRFAGSSSTGVITVRNVTPELTWTANQQEEFIIQVWSESGGSRRSKVFEERVVTTDKSYTLNVPLSWDGNSYQIGFNVIDHGVGAGYVWRRFRVSLPSKPPAPYAFHVEPVNLSGTVVTPFAAYGIKLRASWANRTDDINRAQLRRRVVGESGDGLLIAELTPTGSGPWHGTHTDWSVTSRVDYQYRWDVFTHAGVGSSSNWKR